jgi:hypothetical protein
MTIKYNKRKRIEYRYIYESYSETTVKVIIIGGCIQVIIIEVVLIAHNV